LSTEVIGTNPSQLDHNYGTSLNSGWEKLKSVQEIENKACPARGFFFFLPENRPFTYGINRE